MGVSLCRVEVLPEQFPQVAQREEIGAALRNIGYQFISPISWA